MNEIREFRGQYFFLSNFYTSPIQVEGITFKTVEHAYQAAKTVEQKEKMRIALLERPGDAKRAGRQLILRPNWEDIKLAVMEQLLRLKFQYGGLKQQLRNTENAVLIEGNHWGDTFWGVDLRTGRGENNLGKLLMKIRGPV